MKFREGKVPPATLAGLALLALTAWAAVERFQVDKREDAYREKKAAVASVKRGQDAIRVARRRAGLAIDYERDPQHTGLIGTDDQSGPLTTDKGYLRAKQIATQPNLAAVVVAWLREAKVQKGDFVAVGMTGSFPGANLAVIAAIESLEARPLVITSLGSSTFGANQAEFTWLDMEKAAFDAGAIRTRSLAASIGGDKDKGVGLNKASIEAIRAAIARNGIEKIEEKTLVASISKRMDLYARAAGGLGNIRCYVNVGGGLASVGSNYTGGKLIPTGYSDKWVERNYPVRGVLLQFLKAGKPVVHLNDFRRIAGTHGLSTNPAEPDEPGEGPLFLSRRYNLVLVLGALFGLVAVIVAVGLLDVRHTLFGRPPPSPAQPKVELPPPPRAPDPGEFVP